MSQFTGKLNANTIYTGIFNMILGQAFDTEIISGEDLVDKAKIDAGLYGDSKLFYSSDVLETTEWLGDDEAQNLLKLHRPDSPKCQVITIDDARMVAVTTDQYRTKQAFSTESAFSTFTSLQLSMLTDTKKIHEATNYNAFIGTAEGKSTGATLTVTAEVAADGAQLAEAVAGLVSDMTDYTRDYNDYGFMRRYSESDILVVWNKDYLNRIKYVDLPTIYHNEGLKGVFEGEKLNARYFGTINESATAGNASGTVRSLIEQDIGDNHYFAGDSIATTDTAAAGTSYTEDSKIIAKVMLKNHMPPLMSGFEVGTSFSNSRSLTNTNYLIWLKNSLVLLEGYPYVTIKSA